MAGRMVLSPREIQESLIAIGGCFGDVLRERAIERGVDVVAFSEWMATDQGVSAVLEITENILDRYIA